jgi:hypothetical protein
MLSKVFPIRLDGFMVRMAVIAILIGALAIQLLGWQVIGWILVSFGLSSLFFAYLLGNAPVYENGEWTMWDE